MTHPSISFGEMTTYGEIAISPSPADVGAGLHETDLAVALGLDASTLPARFPPFVTIPVFLEGVEIGVLQKIQYSWGGTDYAFESTSGNTYFSCRSREGLLQHLEEVLQLNG